MRVLGEQDFSQTAAASSPAAAAGAERMVDQGSVGRGQRRGALLAGIFLAAAAAGGAAQSASGVSDPAANGSRRVEPADAQVEANVLRALAGAPALANEVITTRTVYGVVTLTGSVASEVLRSQAEALAANADGVKKVIDELQLGSAAPASGGAAAGDPGGPGTVQASQARQSSAQGGGARPLVLQSDGSYAPAVEDDGGPAPGQGSAGTSAAEGAPGNDASARRPMNQPYAPPYGAQNAPPYRGQGGPPYGNGSAAPYGRAAGGPSYGGGAPGGQPYGYPGQGGLGQGGGFGGGPQAAGGAPVWGGQVGGEAVVVPSGTMVRVRINRTLSSEETPAGTTFDAIVVNDVVAGGEIAIPRGATAEGKVVEAKRAGLLHGRGELSVELTSVTLGGKVYPLVSDQWEHHGGDKSTETVNRAAGLGVVGAVVGAIAGGGAGAAIGGGVGAAAGVGSSAASGRGEVFIPAEGVVTFHLKQEAGVTTVSEAEMARLAQGSSAGPDGRSLRARSSRRVYLPQPYPYGYPGPYGYPADGPYSNPQ